MNKLIYATMIPLLMSSPMENCYPQKENVRKDTSNFGGGYEHDGMYSQTKKLRKGAGKKKLTKAERKKLYAKVY